MLAGTLRGKIRKRRVNCYRQEQLCIAEFWTRYPEYALGEEIIASRAARRQPRGNPLVYVSESSGLRGSRYNVTREIRVPATDFPRRRQSERRNAEEEERDSGDETRRSARTKFICIGPPSLFRAEIQLIGFPDITTRARVQAFFSSLPPPLSISRFLSLSFSLHLLGEKRLRGD